jgi:zinc/manganese transport system permease protein
VIYDSLIAPFAEFQFMRRALVGAVAIALGAAPIGVFLMLRRMSLTGDAIAHGILPGVAVGYLLAGLSLTALTLGGLVAGIAVAIAAAVVSRRTIQREDTSLAAFYLISLALGVLLISLRGGAIDLQGFLFGSVLALDDDALVFLVGTTTLTLAIVALILRPLLMDSFDPAFLRQVSGTGSTVHYAFLALAVLNLVAGFHALGTLMAVGIMILPAAGARFWAKSAGAIIGAAMIIGFVSSAGGLIASFHYDLPSGPTSILVAGLFYVGSMLLGPQGSFLAGRTRTRTG